MEAADLHIVPLTTKNIGDAFLLYEAGLSGSLNFEQFKKKYNNSLYGIIECSHIAYFNNKPIGFYGIIPVMAVKDAKQFLIAQACEFVTDKAFRKQGVHYHLGNKCYELLRAQGCHFVFGFHSNASYFASKKLDWKVADKNMFRFHIPLKANTVNYLIDKIKSPGEKVLIKRIPAKHISEKRDINNILADGTGISIIYDGDYMLYKTFSANHILQFNNVKFWIKIRSFIDIGAIEYTDEADLAAAFAQLINACSKLPVKEIVINAPYNSNLFKALAALYTPLPSWIIGYLDFGAEYSGAQFLCNAADLDTF